MKDLNLWSISPEEERSSQKQFLFYFSDSDFEVIRMRHLGQKSKIWLEMFSQKKQKNSKQNQTAYGCLTSVFSSAFKCSQLAVGCMNNIPIHQGEKRKMQNMWLQFRYRPSYPQATAGHISK